ncbi:hypothetical protein [Clostridium sp. KNHs214]|nr:hypothetical protein [Clostridium sp. KNHs214]
MKIVIIKDWWQLLVDESRIIESYNEDVTFNNKVTQLSHINSTFYIR